MPRTLRPEGEVLWAGTQSQLRFGGGPQLLPQATLSVGPEGKGTRGRTKALGSEWPLPFYYQPLPWAQLGEAPE